MTKYSKLFGELNLIKMLFGKLSNELKGLFLV